MKRILIVLLIFSMLVIPASAEVDLSDLTFDELATLRARCQMEMMLRDEWQEVTVPAGVYEIGKDIPAAYWTITIASSDPLDFVMVQYTDLLDETGMDTDIFESEFYYGVQLSNFENGVHSVDLNLKRGYLIIEMGNAVFTPYVGKPDFGFK